jgi:excisionase family DNA binding protein
MAACKSMEATDALVVDCSTRQLELFAEVLDGPQHAPDERDRTNDRQRPNALGVVPPAPAPADTRSGAKHSPTGQSAGKSPSEARRPRPLPRLAVSPDEAAEMLGVSRDYFDEHVIDELRVVRRGRRILVALTELERWLDRVATRATVGRSS